MKYKKGSSNRPAMELKNQVSKGTGALGEGRDWRTRRAIGMGQ